MQIVKTKKELRRILKELRPGKSIGFVPTMGFLHNGHLSLIEKCRNENDITIVSIFVNPAQFNNASDFVAYPENLKEDAEACRAKGVDVLFVPHRSEFYPEETSESENSIETLTGSRIKTGRELQTGLIQLSLPDLTNVLCGPGRPGHFEGVLLIVARLFNLVAPDNAYFGKKDYQQFRIIEKMANDLDFPVNIVGMPTLREESGLAMSSRNARLTEKGREHASLIHRAMLLGKKAIDEGKTQTSVLCEIVKDIIETGSLNTVEYVQIVTAKNLRPLEDLNQLNDGDMYVMACAVMCEGVRLIDNMEFEY